MGKVRTPPCDCGMQDATNDDTSYHRCIAKTHFNGSLEKLHKAEADAVKRIEDLELNL